jgi:hypothetical protein
VFFWGFYEQKCESLTISLEVHSNQLRKVQEILENWQKVENSKDIFHFIAFHSNIHLGITFEGFPLLKWMLSFCRLCVGSSLIFLKFFINSTMIH